MNTQSASFRGVVHGNIISLLDDPGLPDGQMVSISMQPVEPTEEEATKDALLRAFGAWSDDPTGLDEYLEWNRQQRKIGRPEIAP